MTDYTIDSIYHPDIRIKQSARGYRFALDAVLLAHFIQLKAHERALEAGCGNGVILILLSRLRKYSHLTGVEIQPALAQLARENLALNETPGASIIEGDIRKVENVLEARSFDLIYSNPPYRKAGSGRLNPLEEKAIARHELRMKLEDLFVAARQLLRPTGRLTLILPGFREKDFGYLTEKYGMTLIEHRYVYSFSGEAPAFFLATVTFQSGTFKKWPDLVLYEKQGVYTTETQRLLTER